MWPFKKKNDKALTKFEYDDKFNELFHKLEDRDPNIRLEASQALTEKVAYLDKLISIYKENIYSNPRKAVLAGRVLGKKICSGKREVISEDITEAYYGIRTAFIFYECKHCGKFNVGIPVPTRWLSFFGQKDDKNCNNSLPLLCDYCGKEYFLCWDK